jgi:hypothetical protein
MFALKPLAFTLALSLATLGSLASAAAADQTPTVITITLANAHTIPSSLDLRGSAIAPDSLLVPCSVEDRKSVEPDLDAVAHLISRAGGKRILPQGFSPGAPITTPDGLIFSVKPTQNGSYVIAIDSSHTSASPEVYFDQCLKMATGTSDAIAKLGLLLPRINLAMAQYSPAIGFYLYSSS